MKDYFALLARYNLWATRRLYDSLDALPEADYRGDAGLFFRSIHGTLNHLLVASARVWYRRFAEGVSPRDVQLSDELETDRSALRAALLRDAERWCDLVDSLPVERYAGMIEYTTMRGTAAVLPFAATLGHVFNHGTHHRGQITAALTACGHAAPELDWVYMLQQEQTRPAG
ncbi:MAG: DinB family protein [Hylemonella sp.]|uniref:DinB family protein n=1 Tax=Hylemonella sp. TaxID=2066020 RepID=UPI0022C840FE|nr:DinB family protein [Hylemonella sp.]MCZ8252633.1 DinB family protein [Hylemonella sp.]